MRGKTGTFTLLALAGTAIATLAVLGGSQGSGSEGGTEGTTPIGTAFTYQGRLTDGFDLVNSECDLRFTLWDAGDAGTPFGEVLFDCLLIEDGLVSVDLDFGLEAFDGNERWLQIEVRCLCDPSDMEPFDLLTPRQLLTATPYTIHALDSERLGGMPPSAFLLDADGVIQSNHIRADTIARSHIQRDAVGSTEIRADAINGSKIADGTISRADLGTGSVGSDQVQFNSIMIQHLQINSVGSSQLVRDAQSLSKVSGNVMHSIGNLIGVGTLTPGEKLDVIGDIRASEDIHIGDDLFVTSDIFGDDDLFIADDAVIGGGGTDGALVVRSNGSKSILNLYDGANTKVFTVVDGGNVGIGTSSPNEALDVIGDISVSLDLHVGDDLFVTDRAVIEDNTVIGGTAFDGTLAVRSTGNESILNLWDGSNNKVFTVDGGGRVGIGIADPVVGFNGLDVAGQVLFRDHLLVGRLTEGFGYVEVKEQIRVGGAGFGTGGTNGSMVVRNAATSTRVTARVNADDTGEIALRGANGFDNVLLSHRPTPLNANFGEIAVFNDLGVKAASLTCRNDGLGIVNTWQVNCVIKCFSIPNADEPGTDIVYVCPEGPEAAAYIRGTGEMVNGEGVVWFPAHFRTVVNSEGMTVTVTPLSADSQGLAVVEKGPENFVVRELGNGMGTYEFDYMVMAERKGLENWEVIQPASEFSKAWGAQISAMDDREDTP